MNKLIGEKIAIMSDKAQTTRNKIMCVLTKPDFQIIFLDTPGIHKPHHKLGEFMMKVADDSVKSVDVVAFVIDATKPKGEEEEYILGQLKKVSVPVVLIINKIDKLHDKNALLNVIDYYTKAGKFSALVPVSAKEDAEFPELLEELSKNLPESPNLYPEDMLTDQPERVLAAEMIREKLLLYTREEIPHSVAVEVDSFKERDNGVVYIHATIFVERDSQKGIVIGAKGSMLKKIGQAARLDIEKLLSNPVYLELKVKVRPDWRNSDKSLKEFGYTVR
jgi:GTP-binding protein Era